MIKNYKDLRLEKKRLEQKLAIQKIELKSDFEALKESLRPVSILKDMLGIGDGSVGPLAGAGINAGIDMVVRNNVLAKAGFVIRSIVPLVLKTAVNLFSRNRNKTKTTELTSFTE